MGSSAEKSITASLLFCLCFWACSLVLPVAVSAKDSVKTTSLAQKLPEVGDPLEQQQKEALKAQNEAQRRQRIAREFETLLAKARLQHAQIARWHKERSNKLNAQAMTSSAKKRAKLATTWNR
jgi:hypothetical protein